MTQDKERELYRGYLRDYVEMVTTKSKGNKYVCPICKSGTGKNATGAFSIAADGTHWKCFSCNEYGDIFDLIGKCEGKGEYTEQLKRAEDLFGLPESATMNKLQPKPEVVEPETDYTEFFLQANKELDKTDYYTKRGISRETADRYKLGYVAEWKHPSAPYAPASPRLIIPISKHSYVARYTGDGHYTNGKGDVMDKGKVKGAERVSWILNKQALYKSSKPIFVVEGEMDALSIIEVGGEAVSISSTSGIRSFVNLLKERKPIQPLIIALDNDEPGQEASDNLISELEKLGIPYYRVNPYGKCKDANEALQTDREALARKVNEVEHIEDELEQTRREEYLKNSTANYIQDFINGIANSVNTPYIPTGFSELDRVLDGGLYEGLYIIGAISSLGKTTLVMQIADQIAQSGKDVVIFALEMSRFELMAKSISRNTLIIAKNSGKSIVGYAKTARGITTGKFWESYSREERDAIHDAVEMYKEYAGNIYITEGIGDVGADQIRETVERHKLCTGRVPVVIVDYLQILAPYNEKCSDKQNTDKAVLELKRISRDYKTPVVSISALNRANYKEKISMEAYKESGAIEYGSDVLIGLQLAGAGTAGFDSEEEKRKDPRNIELVILKNRNGETNKKIVYSYYPKFNYYEELKK